MAIGNPLTSKLWWKAALKRALRTALLVAIPYTPATYTGTLPYITLASAAAIGFVLSLLTSWADLPEADGKAQPWWFAMLSRVVKTTAQAALTAIGNAYLLNQVHWSLVLQVTIASAFGSLLLAVLADLPETATPSLSGGQYVNNLVPQPSAPGVSITNLAVTPATPVTDAAPITQNVTNINLNETPAEIAADVAAGTK